MKTQTLASSLVLAGLTRGLWMGAPVERHLERRGTLAGAASGSSDLQSDAERPDISREDRATDPARTGSDCS